MSHNDIGDPARLFIRRLFTDPETIAVLALPPRGEAEPEQRFPNAKAACSDPYMAWLRHLNARGYNIYIGVNPYNPDRQRREKQDVAEVRRLQLDLDYNGTQSLERLLSHIEAGRVPPPVAVVRTSKDRYQILWNAAAGTWTGDEAEAMNRRLTIEYSGDRSATDRSRVFRLPGFRNKKPARGDVVVSWTDHGGGDTMPIDFCAIPDRDSAEGSEAERDDRDRETAEELTTDQSDNITQSERDWAWCREELRNGASRVVTALRLEQRRGDKPNPRYYAERTVNRAWVTIEAERKPRQGIER